MRPRKSSPDKTKELMTDNYCGCPSPGIPDVRAIAHNKKRILK